VLREMPGFSKTLKFLQIFTAYSCNMTQFLRFLAVVVPFSAILRLFSVKISKNFAFFQFQNQANFAGFSNILKKFSNVSFFSILKPGKF
jgi:hypothetical protein